MAYKKEIKACEYCKKEYLGTKHSKYCSQKCTKDSRKKQVTLVCENCNNDFIVQYYRKDISKFCSRKCKHQFMSSELVNLNCTNCNKDFTRKSHKVNNNNFCCKKCADTYNSGANHYEWKELNHIKLRKDAFRKWSKDVKMRDNYKCVKCKNNNIILLEAHHIKPKAKYPKFELDINNGITLCIYCHKNEHINDIKAKRLIEYKILQYEIHNKK